MDKNEKKKCYLLTSKVHVGMKHPITESQLPLHAQVEASKDFNSIKLKSVHFQKSANCGAVLSFAKMKLSDFAIFLICVFEWLESWVL